MSAEYDEPLRIELLQLATLLLKYLQSDLVQHRKELIKFGWNHLKREDNSSKQWAFVNVCHFLEAYQAPEKIILQVFFWQQTLLTYSCMSCRFANLAPAPSHEIIAIFIKKYFNLWKSYFLLLFLVFICQVELG